MNGEDEGRFVCVPLHRYSLTGITCEGMQPVERPAVCQLVDG